MFGEGAALAAGASERKGTESETAEAPGAESGMRVAVWARRIGPVALGAVAVGLAAVGVVQAELTGEVIRWGLPVSLFLTGLLLSVRPLRNRWKALAGTGNGEGGRERGAEGSLEQRVAEAVALRGVNFYGAMTSLTFAVLQVRTFAGEARSTWAEATAAVKSPGLDDWVRGELWSHGLSFFVGVSVDTVLNLVWAAMWPLTWLAAFDLLPTFLLAAAVYLVIRAARLLAPAVAQGVTHWRMRR